MSLKESLIRLSAWYRLAIVASVGWLIGALVIVDPWETLHSSAREVGYSSNNWGDFFLVGVLPVVAFWGLLWVVAGIKKKDR